MEHRLKGFTLIELMITVAIAAILISIAVPSFRNLIINSRLDTIAAELAESISLARSEALSRNRPVLLCQVDEADREKCAAGGDWLHWAVLDNSMDAGKKVLRIGRINTFGGTVKVKSDLASQTAVFAGDGLARTNNTLIDEAVITVCATSGSGEKKRTVSFGAAGRVSVTRVAGVCP
ncbi:GspH/FimT family pseudopilin [Pseudomonas saliphila]|uniref:GspH/FimT family pseudopilin n=1 Tax=Pseudomonas saliphila TaxID=2586906 RepID=UPI001239445F|nr:GspH/FimT family pseudopilin [Pseudomonas saliphila]